MKTRVGCRFGNMNHTPQLGFSIVENFDTQTCCQTESDNIFIRLAHVADFSSNCLQLDESGCLKCLQVWLIFIRFDETLVLGHDTQFWCNSLFNYCQNHDKSNDYIYYADKNCLQDMKQVSTAVNSSRKVETKFR